MVDAARTHPIRIYIDALDECGEDVATEFVEFLRLFADPISICFSCRHYPFVALEGGNEVCVEQENKKDIEIYIDEKINTHVQRMGIAQVIRNEMLSRSKSNFQWVVLVLPRVLKMHKSRKSLLAIQTMIWNIPAELNELYTTLLNFDDEYERAQSLRLLQWISFAFRPLTLRELRHALAVNADTRHSSLRLCQSPELSVDTDEDMERIVCDLSKGLAEVIGNDSERVAQFVHQSVKDFLVEQGFQSLDHASAGTVVGRGHFWLSRSCVKYFLQKEIQDLPVLSTQYDINKQRQTQESFPMLDYSVKYLLHHLEEVEMANMSQDDLVALDSEPTDHILQRSWFDIYQRNLPSYYRGFEGETLLHVASNYNLISVVKAILARIPWADRKDQRSRTPLFIAAESGHTGVVEMLIGREDVDINSKDEMGDTPLSLAVKRSNEAMIIILLNRSDVNVNSKDKMGDTPLSIAVGCGNEAIVKILLNRDDVDVNSRNMESDTPLSIAITRKHKTMVEILLNRDDVDVNSKNRYGDTPFSGAARSGHVSITKLLVERGVDLSLHNNQLRKAFTEAASYGRYKMMKLLLEENADANARDNLDRTPLSYAAFNGHLAIVELLLQHNADIDSRDNLGRTPLSHVAFNGHLAIVELLLQNNADINSRDSKGRTPLLYATSNNFPDIIRLLLQHNGDIDSRDIKGRTPLSYAASRGHIAVVKLLLEGSSNADQKAEDGRTPFSYAVCCGDMEVAKAFLERRYIDINSKDNDGRSPLSWALSKGRSWNVPVVKLLLKQDDIVVTREDRHSMKQTSYFEQYLKATEISFYNDLFDKVGEADNVTARKESSYLHRASRDRD